MFYNFLTNANGENLLNNAYISDMFILGAAFAVCGVCF